MTIYIERTGIRASSLVDSNSRYKNASVVYYSEQKFITFETYLRKPYIPNGSESVMLITKGIEYRPDLVSYDVYGVPDYWWKILEANLINDIWGFKVGVTIFIPSIF